MIQSSSFDMKLQNVTNVAYNCLQYVYEKSDGVMTLMTRLKILGLKTSATRDCDTKTNEYAPNGYLLS